MLKSGIKGKRTQWRNISSKSLKKIIDNISCNNYNVLRAYLIRPIHTYSEKYLRLIKYRLKNILEKRNDNYE